MSTLLLKVFTLPAILALLGKVFQRWLAMDAKELRCHLLLKKLFVVTHTHFSIESDCRCMNFFIH